MAVGGKGKGGNRFGEQSRVVRVEGRERRNVEDVMSEE
jgi:hypothetical protein